jgi:hypothetical protein
LSSARLVCSYRRRGACIPECLVCVPLCQAVNMKRTAGAWTTGTATGATPCHAMPVTITGRARDSGLVDWHARAIWLLFAAGALQAVVTWLLGCKISTGSTRRHGPWPPACVGQAITPWLALRRKSSFGTSSAHAASLLCHTTCCNCNSCMPWHA